VLFRVPGSLYGISLPLKNQLSVLSRGLGLRNAMFLGALMVQLTNTIGGLQEYGDCDGIESLVCRWGALNLSLVPVFGISSSPRHGL